MDYVIKLGHEGISWYSVCELIKKAGLATHSLEDTERAFKHSYISVFIFHKDLLIGTGRALSDGVYQAAIYDIAVLPEYQKKGIGKIIMDELEKNLIGINIILYANPSAESFYKKLGYSKMLTGMAKFVNNDSMRTKGFIQ